MPGGVLNNVKAKLALAEGDLAAALTASDAALHDERDSQNLVVCIRVAIARGEAQELSVGQVSAQVKLWAKELDALGELASILDLSKRFPKYFDS